MHSYSTSVKGTNNGVSNMSKREMRDIKEGLRVIVTAGAAGITLSTANSAYDVVPYIVKADNSVLLGAPQLAFG